MIRYHISLVFLILAACILQQFLPVFSLLYDARILLLQLVFLCSAVTIGFSPMLVLAFLCGILWDAQTTLGPQGGDPEIYNHPIDSLRFGYSTLLFAAMGLLMQGVQPLFRRGAWQISVIIAGVTILLYLLIEYLLINFIRGQFTFPRSVMLKIWLSASLTMICSPLIFAIQFKLAKWFHYTIRYDGIKRRYFGSEPFTLDT